MRCSLAIRIGAVLAIMVGKRAEERSALHNRDATLLGRSGPAKSLRCLFVPNDG